MMPKACCQCLARVHKVPTIALRFRKRKKGAGVIECGRLRVTRIEINVFLEQFLAFLMISRVHQASEIAQRSPDCQRIGCVELALQIERLAVIRFCQREVADLRIKRRTIIQKRSISRMLFAQLLTQQFARFVVEFFSGRIMPQIGLQVRVTNQARRIRRVVHSRLHAQDVSVPWRTSLPPGHTSRRAGRCPRD